MDPKVANTHMSMRKTKNCKTCVMKLFKRFRTQYGHKSKSDTDAIYQSHYHDSHSNFTPSPTAIIYSSELEYIARCIKDSRILKREVNYMVLGLHPERQGLFMPLDPVRMLTTNLHFSIKMWNICQGLEPS